MEFYAIKETTSDFYVTRFRTLDRLNNSTKLYLDYCRALQDVQDGYGMEESPLINSLTWFVLENKYGQDRRFIDVSYKEFSDVRDKINLKIVQIDPDKELV